MTVEVADIWREFGNELRSFIARRVKHHADPDDVLQDVFLKILTNQDKLEKSNHLKQYLHGMVRNAIYDVFRKQKPHVAIEDVHLPWTEEDGQSLTEVIAECCVRPFVDELPEKYRDALIDVEFNHKPQKELASELGISYSAAKSRVQRGREKLKEQILCCCAAESDKYGNLMQSKMKNCDC